MCLYCRDDQFAHDRLPGHDSHKGPPVIHHRDEALTHGPVQQLFHGHPDTHRGVEPLTHHRAQGQLLLGAQAVVLPVHHAPKKVPFAHGTHIPAVPGQYRQGGVLMGSELFQSLSNGAVLVQVGHLGFGRQQGYDIHGQITSLKLVLPISMVIA